MDVRDVTRALAAAGVFGGLNWAAGGGAGVG